MQNSIIFRLDVGTRKFELLGANLAWFGRPSWGQVAAKLLGSRPKSALVSGLDSEPGSELPFATPVDQIEPGSIEFGRVRVLRLIRELNV